MKTITLRIRSDSPTALLTALIAQLAEAGEEDYSLDVSDELAPVLIMPEPRSVSSPDPQPPEGIVRSFSGKPLNMPTHRHDPPADYMPGPGPTD